MAECLALADLDASINLMPLSVWNKLSLPNLSPMCMTLELADRSISHLVGVAEDVFVKIGTFHLSADFIVVDFDGDPRAITFNLNQTLRYSANYNDMTANRIDVIDMACNKITNPKEHLKGITTRSRTAYQGPTIPTTSSSLPSVVERETEATKDTVHPTNNGSPKDVPPPVVQTKSLILNSEPVVAPIIEPVVAPFNISFADAFILMPKFCPTIKTLLTNKDKLSELARTPLNEHCSVVLLKKLPKKLRDPSKFLIPSLKAKMAEINKNLMRVLQVNQQVKAVTLNCKTCGGPQFFNDCPATVGQTQNVYATGAYQDLKGIITRSGTAYQGPTIPTTSSSPKVVERETEVTKDTVPPTNNGSTKDVLPPVVQVENQIPNSEPVVSLVLEPVAASVSASKHNPKLSIPYPSRLRDQKLRDKANDQKETFFKIFKDLDFNISFADALILMPKFGPTIKSLLTNKEKLFELARTLLNEHCSVVLLKKLLEKLGDPSKFLIPCDFPGMDECLALADLSAGINLMPLSMWNKLSLPELSPTCMTLELTDRSISRPVGVTEDVFVKVGTFYFSGDFVVVDFDADPRVPLILERSFLKTGRALIDVYEGELTVRVGNKAITFNLDQTSRYSANYDAMDSDFLLEEINAFLAIDDEPISPKINKSYYDTEEDILLLEELLNDDPSSPPLPPQEPKVVEPTNEKYSIDEPPVVELKDLPTHLEFAFLEDLKYEEKTDIIKSLGDPVHCVPKKGGFTVVENEENELIPTRLVTGWREKSHFIVKESIILGHKISKNGIEVDKAKVDVIAKLPHPTTFKECIEAFQTLKRKLTEAPILVAPDWDLPFELMCDASDFAIGAVLGHRKTKHFQPIHYASKIMIDAQAHYTTTEKELLAVVYAFEKFWPYLILSKSIVYRDHSALRYLFNKQDVKPRLPRWVLLLQEFDIIIRDKKGAENLAADHLFRLENPHQSELDKKEINETFPLETLNVVSFRGYSSTPCITFGMTPSCLKSLRIKSSGDVFMARKPLIFSWLSTIDPSGDIMARTTPPKREKFHNGMKCLKIPSKFARFLTFGASIPWGRSRLHEGTKKTKRIHDSKIKDRIFKVDDQVLLFNSRLKNFSSKLKTRWSGPFTITQVFPYGNVELSQTDGPNFKVNGHRLNHYFGEDIPKMVVPDLQTFPKDQ
nr:reverse transcriptase domain-containing protein [Tanacetum cinerariifolium]